MCCLIYFRTLTRKVPVMSTNWLRNSTTTNPHSPSFASPLATKSRNAPNSCWCRGAARASVRCRAPKCRFTKRRWKKSAAILPLRSTTLRNPRSLLKSWSTRLPKPVAPTTVPTWVFVYYYYCIVLFFLKKFVLFYV